eukprot:m.144356 g.144356  ORF g.144356 m.144356 type:complete len:198 (+) comp17710_c0_seq2:86-679(+)
MAAAGHDREADSAEEIRAPLVFMCQGCSSIVGDSFAWVCSDESSNSLTLHAVPDSVRVMCNEDTGDEELHTSRDRRDFGSTFAQLQCCKCDDVLGKLYRSTPRRLDTVRDMYTLDVSKIISYELGRGASREGLEDIMSLSTADALQSDIVKLQNMVLVLNEKIELLEQNTIQKSSTDTDGESSATGASRHARKKRRP